MIRVRAARPEDIEALAEIGLAAWKEAIKPLVAADVAKRIENNNPFLPFLRDQGARVLVAELDGALVGLGASEHGDNNISDIWISPLHEGKGAGSALITALEQVISDRGFADVTIQVAAANKRALSLYRHLGYVEQWRREELDPILGVSFEKVGPRKTLC